MSTLLRLPLALLTALAMLLLWSGVASAEGEDGATPPPPDCLLDIAALGCEQEQSAPQEPPVQPSGTEDRAQDEPMGPSDAEPAFTGTLQELHGQESLDTSSEDVETQGTDEQQADEQEGGQTSASSDSPPDPAVVGECIATRIGALLAVLQESVTGAADDLVAEIEGALTNPTTLPAFVAGLPTFIETNVPELAEELSTELPAAIEGIAACLPIPTSPPAEEEPPAAEPAAQPTQQEVHYANCDDARAKGAAPVHAGQPGYGAHLDSDNDGIGCEQEVMAVSHTPTPQAQLAYTGFDVGPFAGAGAAMLAAGSLLVAGARRRS